MNTDKQKQLLLENMVELLELPKSAYKKAAERYEDIGEYLGRKDSACYENDPHIFPQGSFRLGTAIRPLDESEEYDLDLSCSLSMGISHDAHTQENLKHLLGTEIESYRKARGIKQSIEEKHRCWRLEYADQLSFHMDIAPCIPEDTNRKRTLFESMIAAGENHILSSDISALAISITDDRHPQYKRISDDWNVSNPEGYAKWFESRLENRSSIFMAKSQVDELPLYTRKSPLQRSIQILKRHRDQMFRDDPDVKPISIIITTISARAYSGQDSLYVCLQKILGELKRFSDSGSTTVFNPVNPAENFADRWTMPQYKHLQLKQNFSRWVTQINADFDTLLSSSNAEIIIESATRKFALKPNKTALEGIIGISAGPAIHTKKSHEVTNDVAKPWSFR